MKVLTVKNLGRQIFSARANRLNRFVLLLAMFVLAGFGQAARGADGDLDPTFGSGGKVLTDLSGGVDNLKKIALQPDGKIVAAGDYRISNGNSHIQLARYNSDGSLDATFGTNGRVTTTVSIFGETANDVVIQPDGKIVIVGSVKTPSGGDTAFLVVRYNPNGSLDTAFGSKGVVITNFGDVADTANTIALQSDGKIIAAGEKGIFRPPGEERNTDIAIVRYNTNGSIDTSFGNGGKTISDFGPVADYFADDAADIIILPNGKFIIVGDSDGSGYYDFLIARYNSDGTLDTTFGTNGRTKTDLGNGYQDGASAAALQADGKIVSVGAALPSSYDLDFSLIRYNADGSLDTTFGTGGKVVFGLENLRDEELNAVAIQRDGKILAAGDSNSANNSGFLLWRFNPNGTRDTTFGNNGLVRTTFGSNAAFTNSLLIQPDAKILVAGLTPLYQSTDFALARYLNTQTSRPAQFDFDGDAKADISIFCDGIWNIQRSASGLFAFQFGISGDLVVPADYDGDKKTDIAVFRPSDGNWYWLNSGSNTYTILHFGLNGDVPVATDYDGDGRADYAVYRAGVWYIQRSTAGLLITQFGLSSDKPVAADYDGDGKADIAVYRPSTGEWWINRSSNGTIVFQFGTATDKAVPADYTGDGKTDVAVWRPSTGEWFILRSENQSYYSVPFGLNGDIPVVADYDGDAKADMAIYRGAGEWWISRSRTNDYLFQQFGNENDMPVPSAFIR